MGDYSNLSDVDVSTSVYHSFKAHFSANVSNTELTVLESIRRIHPDKHITPIARRYANLIEFADAGNATATLIRDGDQFVNQHLFTPAESRMQGGDGKLYEKIIFGRYDYEYQGNDLIVYQIEWLTNGCPTQMQYILSSKDRLVKAQCPVAGKLIIAAGKRSSQLHEQVYVYDSGQWIKSRQLWESIQAASWDDVILEPTMKDTLIKDVESFYDSRAVYEEHSVPWKRGIILHGTPGCGKTISIKALMNSLQKRDVASLYVKSFEASQGQQYSIRYIFQQARIMAPCLLIFEDLDSLVVDKVRSYFLNEVDGLENNDGILMIGSTNHLERLDPGISKRPSRFDRKYHYQLPGKRERILYCQYWRKKLQKNDKIEFHEDICEIVAQLSEGFSFAYLKELFIQTLLTIVGGKADVEEEDEKAEGEESIATVAEHTKIVDGSASLIGKEQSLESATGEPSKDAPVEEKMPTREMPDVAIPEHLQSNPLMRILQKQAKALWKEMDNTVSEEIHNRVKVSDGKANQRVVRRVQQAQAVKS